MGTTFFVLALLQCALLFFLSRVGSRLDREERKPAPQRTHWPRTGLIVPAGGNHPRMREALESLLKQDYPALYPVIVTATADEPAAGIARELQARYPQLRHVVAGFAKGCGQKNHNSLKGVEAVEDEVELLAFCDSTHIAPRDFIRRLVAPVVDGEDFSTGYHKVVARDTGIVTMAYALCVQLMRYLQGISSFTQLWGGAMCFRLSAFRRYGVREFWMSNVVDDCSLADRLIHLGARIRLSGDAVLMTEAREHDLGVWHHWMDRQILFLKFCIPYQWVLLGVLACLMLLPVLWAVLAVLGVLLGKLSFGWLVGVLVYAAALALVLRSWAHFQEAVFPVWRWMSLFAPAPACSSGFIWVPSSRKASCGRASGMRSAVRAASSGCAARSRAFLPPVPLSYLQSGCKSLW